MSGSLRRFRIECEIGTGGMGAVYRATHLGLERPVAVKIIKPEFAADPDVADRFMREARTMAKLRHPHAAMIFDAGNLPDGRHFIIMEFVEGRTLSQVLAQEGPFTPERAVRIAVEICDVLAEAHQLGIIHRDLKPSNIMLNERGVCVLDFGVAKVLATSTEAATHASTGSGQIVGTPRYMSPEQCLGQRVGARSDLYSLGVLLYEMLAGRPPFIDALQSAVLVKQATAAPPPLPRLRQGLPQPLTLAVHTLLAKRPEDRPTAATDARAMLERSIARPRRIAPEIEPMSSTVAAVSQDRSPGLRLVASLALVVLFGALLLAWGYRGQTALADLSSARVASSAEIGISSSNSGDLRSSTFNGKGSAVLVKAKASSTNASPTLSLDQARSVVTSLSHGSIGDLEVVQTDAGPVIVAVHDESRAGTSHFFVLEKRGASFKVTARGPLDVPGFRKAKWLAETLDTDGDGQKEVLFTGTGAGGRSSGYRFALYVPRTHLTYSLRVETDARTGKPTRTDWSPNALLRDSAHYRAAIRQSALKAIVATSRH